MANILNLVTCRNFKSAYCFTTTKTRQTVNKQHADTILDKRANYARALNPVGQSFHKRHNKETKKNISLFKFDCSTDFQPKQNCCIINK